MKGALQTLAALHTGSEQQTAQVSRQLPYNLALAGQAGGPARAAAAACGDNSMKGHHVDSATLVCLHSTISADAAAIRPKPCRLILAVGTDQAVVALRLMAMPMLGTKSPRCQQLG